MNEKAVTGGDFHTFKDVVRGAQSCEACSLDSLDLCDQHESILNHSPPTTRAADRIEDVILNGPPYMDSQRPILTQSDIAENLDVSKQTVRRHIKKAASHPEICTGKIGQAKVYWREFARDDGENSNQQESGHS